MVSREQWTDGTQCEEVEIVNGAETHWKIVTHYNSAETPGTRGGEIVTIYCDQDHWRDIGLHITLGNGYGDK